MDIIKILNDGGFSTVEGKNAVLKAIKDSAGPSSKPLCSGFGVFPNGKRCDGCSDCDNHRIKEYNELAFTNDLDIIVAFKMTPAEYAQGMKEALDGESNETQGKGGIMFGKASAEE